MTKRDFEAIAAILHKYGTEPGIGRNTRGWLIGLAAADLADYLASTNPRFDRDRFLRACGVAS